MKSPELSPMQKRECRTEISLMPLTARKQSLSTPSIFRRTRFCRVSRTGSPTAATVPVAVSALERVARPPGSSGGCRGPPNTSLGLCRAPEGPPSQPVPELKRSAGRPFLMGVGRPNNPPEQGGGEVDQRRRSGGAVEAGGGAACSY